MRPASSHSPRRCRAHALAGPAARLSRLRLPRSGQGQAAAEGARPLPGPAARSRKDARARLRALGDNRAGASVPGGSAPGDKSVGRALPSAWDSAERTLPPAGASCAPESARCAGARAQQARP